MILEVNRSDFRATRLIEEPRATLQNGQVRLRIERFALTANNVSYAVSGDLLGYWDFFPAAPGWGRVPAMSIATVNESAHQGIECGGRYFGFTPMADELVIDAEPRPGGFRDVGEHRAAHAGTYVQFSDLEGLPDFDDHIADEYLLLRGLFMTSFLIDDYLADNGDFDAEQVIVTSASSKTSIALAYCLQGRNATVIGLTSPANRSFVEGLGLYSTVLSYDDIEDLDASVPTNLVDMAGNGRVRERVHSLYRDNLAYSGIVGATHWEAGGVGALAGPTPSFFFAPAQIDKRNNDWGVVEAQRRITTALTAFVADAKRWLDVRHVTGPYDAQKTFVEVVDGNVPPDTGIIVSMSSPIPS